MSFSLCGQDSKLPHLNLVNLPHFKPQDHRSLIPFLYFIVMSPLTLLTLVGRNRFALWVKRAPKVSQFQPMILKLPLLLNTDQIRWVEGLNKTLLTLLLHEKIRNIDNLVILKLNDHNIILPALKHHDFFRSDGFERCGWIIKRIFIKYFPIFITMNKDLFIETSTT